MLQTTPISGAPPPALESNAPAPRPGSRTAALRIEDGIAAAPENVRAATGRTASVARKARAASASKAATSGYAKATAKTNDFDFLRDPKLTLEQKLMRFMIMMAKKLDEDIQRRMEELAPKDAAKQTSSSKSTASKKSSRGFFGKVVSGILKAKPLRDLLKQVTGPVLAAGASALGFPALAPLLLKAGPALGQLFGEIVGSLDGGGSAPGSRAPGSSKATSSASSSSSSSSGTSGMSATEERLKMMELQQVMEKQKEMFTLVSNMLRTFHDMRMSAVNNIR
jgi:hypothetical protein